jgi:hypothetical protein
VPRWRRSCRDADRAAAPTRRRPRRCAHQRRGSPSRVRAGGTRSTSGSTGATECRAREAAELPAHLELAAFYSKIAVAYTQIVTISTDDILETREFRAAVGAQWTFLSDVGRTLQKDLDIQEYTDPYHDPMVPHTLVLKPRLVIHSVYNGARALSGGMDSSVCLHRALREFEPGARAGHPAGRRRSRRPHELESNSQTASLTKCSPYARPRRATIRNAERPS